MKLKNLKLINLFLYGVLSILWSAKIILHIIGCHTGETLVHSILCFVIFGIIFIILLKNYRNN